jgi:putative tricarboxylic transport membrane protein
MAKPDNEIVVEDADAPAEDSPPIVGTNAVENAVYLMLLGVAALLGFDNWRTGMGWASDGPQAGYFPFYLSVVLAGASLYGLVCAFLARAKSNDVFVTRDQIRRVLQVFIPTLLYCFFTQWLGLYVASFLLVAGFMRVIGRIALWKCVVTSLVFVLAMFVTFQIAFDVIMPLGPLERALGY